MAQYSYISKLRCLTLQSRISNPLFIRNFKASTISNKFIHFCCENKTSTKLYNLTTRSSLPLISSPKYNYDKYNEESHSKKSYAGRTPLIWCLLGFSLRDYLGLENKDEEKDSELLLMIKKGAVAFYNKEYDQAESLLHVALKYAQDVSDEKAVTYIFDILANLAYQRQDFPKAEKLFKSVLQRYASEEGRDFYSNEFIAVSLKIANCYAAMRDLTNSIKGFHYCIGAQAEKLKMVPPAAKDSDANPSSINLEDQDSLVLYAMSLEQYAGLVASLGHNSTAQLFLKEAMRICIAVNGEEHLQTAVLRNAMGAIMARGEKYSEASKEIQMAIDIAKAHIEKEEKVAAESSSSIWNYFISRKTEEKKVGPIPNANEENAMSSLATFYINLGGVKLLSGELKAAKCCCEEGEVISKRALNEDATDEARKCLKTVNETMMKSKKNKSAEAA